MTTDDTGHSQVYGNNMSGLFPEKDFERREFIIFHCMAVRLSGPVSILSVGYSYPLHTPDGLRLTCMNRTRGTPKVRNLHMCRMSDDCRTSDDRGTLVSGRRGLWSAIVRLQVCLVPQDCSSTDETVRRRTVSSGKASSQ